MGEHRALRPPGRARRVEDHRGVFFADISRFRQRRMIGEPRKVGQARIVVDDDAMLQIGHVLRIGHALGERGLVDQRLGAAIGQHIGDLGLLLARAEQHRDEAQLRRRKQDQRKLDAVAEQDRNAVAALQAEALEARGDLLRAPHRLAPRQPLVAADQRLAVAIARGGLLDHGPDVFRPLAESRHHAVAEARFKPHRRNGNVRPVHQPLSFMP